VKHLQLKHAYGLLAQVLLALAALLIVNRNIDAVTNMYIGGATLSFHDTLQISVTL
jgi:hypothetical protein